MPKARSTKSRYESQYGGGWCSGAQFIAEVMVERIAGRTHTILPLKFWNTTKWKKCFLTQLRFANGLLKIYSVEAILKALRTPEGRRIYSLRAPWLDDLIKKEEEKIEALKDTEPTILPFSKVTEKPREPFIKPNIISKLKDLDG